MVQATVEGTIEMGGVDRRELNFYSKMLAQWRLGAPLFDRNGRLVGLTSKGRSERPVVTPIELAVEGPDAILSKYFRSPKLARAPFPEPSIELWDPAEQPQEEALARGQIEASVVRLTSVNRFGEVSRKIGVIVAPHVILTRRRIASLLAPISVGFNNPVEEEPATVERALRVPALAVLVCAPEAPRCAHARPLALRSIASLPVGTELTFLGFDAEDRPQYSRGRITFKIRRLDETLHFETDLVFSQKGQSAELALDDQGRIVGFATEVTLRSHKPERAVYVQPIDLVVEGERALLEGFLPTSELSTEMQDLLVLMRAVPEEGKRLYDLERAKWR